MIANVWIGAVPEASVMEMLWREGKLPQGIYPPLSILTKYPSGDDENEESGMIPDESEYVNSL